MSSPCVTFLKGTSPEKPNMITKYIIKLRFFLSAWEKVAA